MNELLFVMQVAIISLGALGALKLGKEALVSYICLLGILSNLFISKQIALFGCDVTGGEAFAVGAIFGLNVLQEFFGRDIIKKTILASFALLFFYLIMSQIHLWFIPNEYDIMHEHFVALLNLMPRITLASITTYLIVQSCDAFLYRYLKKLFQGNYLLMRTSIALICSQLLDTIMFTYLGLYGIVAQPVQVIIVSMIIKLLAIAATAPFIMIAKKCIARDHHA